MMRGMMSGVSGLKVHQLKMDVIGNNISNVNTVAFKSSRVTFKEVFSQQLSGATGPDMDRGSGGINPTQIGMGADLATIDMNYTQGTPQRTDNDLDISISGDGLFIVRESSNSPYTFTRAGMFSVDKAGNLISGTGGVVQGWMELIDDPNNPGEKTFNTESPLVNINLYADNTAGNKRIVQPKATDNVVLAGNLNINSEDGVSVVVPTTVVDSFGNSIGAQITYTKVDEDNWEYTITSEAWDAANNPTGTLTFSLINDVATGKAKGKIIEDDQSKKAFPLKFNGNAGSVADEETTVTFDFNMLTMYSADSSPKIYSTNGYSSGSLEDFSVGADGVITGIYSNGIQQPLAMIALATFENYQGLQKVGDSSYVETANSGTFSKSRPGEGGGNLKPGTLEMSNVDLANEFTEMITTQRGYQANSKIITTSDEMLEQLVNLKR